MNNTKLIDGVLCRKIDKKRISLTIPQSFNENALREWKMRNKLKLERFKKGCRK